MNEQAQQIVDYIVENVLARPEMRDQIKEDTALVSSGLIDSFALVDILLELEKVTNMRIPAGKVQPKDMDTITIMFATAERVGKPRKKKK